MVLKQPVRITEAWKSFYHGVGSYRSDNNRKGIYVSHQRFLKALFAGNPLLILIFFVLTSGAISSWFDGKLCTRVLKSL